MLSSFVVKTFSITILVTFKVRSISATVNYGLSQQTRTLKTKNDLKIIYINSGSQRKNVPKVGSETVRLKESFYLGLLICKNRKLETYGRKFICKVLPFSIILDKLVTHCFNIIGSHESLPLTIEVPTQGHGSGPYHGGIWHAHLLHGVGQVDHDHPHSTRPRLRSIIINIKTWRTYVNHSPICYASF